MYKHFYLSFILGLLLGVKSKVHYYSDDWRYYDGKYGYFSEEDRHETLEDIREMFYFGYDNYMKHAFPQDELDPIHCTGRGPDYENPFFLKLTTDGELRTTVSSKSSNININDVLGDYALTLVDTLDTLAVMGNSTEFKKAVVAVIENVSFDKPSTVQVFEATIRILGGLLSAHVIITDPVQPFGDMVPPAYENELLSMAHDLAARLLPAFENTATGIPYPRVHLQHGIIKSIINETCTSGAGTLLLEFGVLSRLLKDPVYESLARRVLESLWSLRSNVTGLFGNVVNIQSGQWVGLMSGLGAGLDSFFEYMFKAFILFGETEDLQKFNESYETIKYYMRKGRKSCNNGTGFPPIYVNVNMKNGDVLNHWIDALQAAWPGVQVLSGDIEEAICAHALYYAIWKRYGGLPERYNWNLKAPDVLFYPLRPELIESTYLLYQATKNPFYLHVGRDIVNSLNTYTKAECGYATIHDVHKKDLEDRMESFFLSETCKYLYLLFDSDNPINKDGARYLFTTEGHVFPILQKFRKKTWNEDQLFDQEEKGRRKRTTHMKKGPVINQNAQLHNHTKCQMIPEEKQYFLPIKSRYLNQLESLIGLA